jgi:hypothetical protein
MRTQTATPVMNIRFSEVILYYVFLACILFAVASCSDDDEARPDTRAQFIGTYAVEDVSSYSGHIYEYDMTISNGPDGDLHFSNFADMFNTPVKAMVDGNKITIKPQSFTNASSGNTIHVSGSGTLSGNVLNFTYTTTGYLDYTGTCKATKNNN